MPPKTLNNSLFDYLLNSINQALPLEYGIRAARRADPHKLAQLAEINDQIVRYWLSLGVSAEEVSADHDLLVAMAWDAVQIGFPLARRHGLRHHPELRKLIYQGLTGVQQRFGDQVKPLLVPATQYFRVFDLLHGNDIATLMDSATQCLADAEQVNLSRHDEELDEWERGSVELDKFPSMIREPIHLHPAIEYVATTRTEGNRTIERFGMIFDTAMEISIEDVYRQVRELLYQYAMRRPDHWSPVGSRVSDDLINAFLADEFQGLIEKHKINRKDGLIGPLVGLLCWDLAEKYQQDKVTAPIESAVADIRQRYAERNMSDSSVESYFKQTRAAINRMPFGKATRSSVHKTKSC